MIAIQTVLGLVEPQSSGIGGGAFAVYYDADSDRLTTFDARETTPSGATEGRLQDSTGANLNFLDAWQSTLSVGVPGVPRLMETMHAKYGKLPWADLFEDATKLATEGFPLTARTESSARRFLLFDPSCQKELFFRDEVFLDYLFEDRNCTLKTAGTLLQNPEYAATLQTLANQGATALYSGDLAASIVAKLAADRNPSGDAIMTLEDLMNYQVIEREPVCTLYRNKHRVCGMGPPSSGGLAVGQILGILDQFNISGYEILDVDTVHLFTQAMRLAFADRNLFVGDSDFVTVPVEGMLDADYLQERSKLINMTSDMGMADAGVPPGTFDPSTAQTTSNEGGTSHISIVDMYGNALSMTSSIESPFGSGLMVGGFLLNNQLTDFSFTPSDANGTAIANRVQAGKRPRSSMSPSIVLDGNGKLRYLAGSPGGSRIIGYTSQALMSMLDFGFDPKTAAGVPSFQNRNDRTELEPPTEGITTIDYDTDALSQALTERNHILAPLEAAISGLGLISIEDDGDGKVFLGGADPRRDGTVGGRQELSTTPMPQVATSFEIPTPSPQVSNKSVATCCGAAQSALNLLIGSILTGYFLG